MEELRNILGIVREEKEQFINGFAEISPGYFFNQHKTIRRIENYYNSRFESGPNDEDGFLKPFYNIVRKPVQVCSKEIDLDTKDILVRSEDGDFITAELMAADLKQWMKDEGFAKKLNVYADEAPEYGTVVVKKVGKHLHTVDLRNLSISNLAAKSLSHTNVIESHEYSYDEFRETAAASNWDADKVEEVIALHEKLNASTITVDERYGLVTEDVLEAKGDATKLAYTLAITAGTNLVETTEAKDGKPAVVVQQGVVITHRRIQKHPYREWHFMSMKGRWLGIGFVEILFNPQVRANEMAYYKAKGLNWTSLHIYQSDDETVSRNLVSSARDGDVIKTQMGRTILPIAVEERNLAHYRSEEVRWDQNISDLTFSPEVIGGENLPSGTPARSAIISDANVKRFFDRKREDFGIFLQEIIAEDILPLFKDNRRSAHRLSIAASSVDRDKLEGLIFNARMNQHFEAFMKNGKIPSLEEWLRLSLVEKQKLARQPSIDIPIVEGAYDRINEKISIVITKENEDTDARIQGRQIVLTALAANPAIATNPTTRPIFLEIAELLGVKHAQIPSLTEMQTMMPQQQPPAPGGPQGAPSPAPNPLAAVPA